MNFKGFIFNLLPTYFKLKDSYKNNQGKGLLERYLEIYEDEIDEEILPLIHNYLNQVDISRASNQFLTELAYSLGTPPDIFGGTDEYRKMLLFAIRIYKIKGTAKAFELLFGLLDINVVVEEDPVGARRYDEQWRYDQTDVEMRWDMGKCEPCSCYHLHLTGSIILTPTILSYIKTIIIFNEPINATLCSIDYNGEDILTQLMAAFISDTTGLINGNEPYIEGELIITIKQSEVITETFSLDALGNLIVEGPNADKFYIDSRSGQLVYRLDD